MKSTVVRTIAALFVIFLLVGCNDAEEPEAADLIIEGKWKLADESPSLACFTQMRFLENPTSDRDPVSVHETTGNSTKVWYGEYEKKGNDIEVELLEPKAEPFMMTAERSEDELKLRYEWKSADLVCTYQPD